MLPSTTTTACCKPMYERYDQDIERIEEGEKKYEDPKIQRMGFYEGMSMRGAGMLSNNAFNPDYLQRPISLQCTR